MDDMAESVVVKAERDQQEKEVQPFIGQVFGGNYKITKLIGIGGMSYVLMALDQSLGREVAVKVLLREYLKREDMVKRFLNEAKTIASLTDKKHVVEIFSIGIFSFEGEERKWPFYVMQYLPGEDLEEIMNDRFENGQQFTFQEIYAIMSQVFEGLTAAHDVGVIHRDLKPGNIKMASTGRELRVKIVDFGISRTLAGEGKSVSGLTQDGQFFGTPHIVPPEQIRAEHDKIRAWSDIYSAGCMLFCLLTGRYPFEHESPAQVLAMQLVDSPPKLSELRPDVSPELDAVVLKALEKEPKKRWQNAMEFKAALKKAVGGRDITTSHSLIPRAVFDNRSNGKGDEDGLSDCDSTAVSQDFDAAPPPRVEISATGPTAVAPSHPPEARNEEASADPENDSKRTLLGMVLVGGVVLMAIVFVIGLALAIGKKSCNTDDDAMVEAAPAHFIEKPDVTAPQVPEVEEEVEEEIEEEPSPYLVEKISSQPTSTKPKAVKFHELARHDQTSWNGIQKYLGNKSNCLRARPTLEIIVKHEPNFPDAHFFLAECYRRSKKQKQKHKAAYHYKKYLQLAPPGHEWAFKAKKYVH